MNTQNDYFRDYNKPKGWISLTEYSVKHGVSISTLRRYIRENRTEFKVIKSKYFLKDEPISRKKRGRKPGTNLGQLNSSTDGFIRRNIIKQHLDEIKNLKQELSELKMYVSILEQKLGLGETQGINGQ